MPSTTQFDQLVNRLDAVLQTAPATVAVMALAGLIAAWLSDLPRGPREEALALITRMITRLAQDMEDDTERLH